MNPKELREFLQGKFVDALRLVAAGLTMDQLHEQRAEFVQEVQGSLSEDLLKTGLELEFVSTGSTRPLATTSKKTTPLMPWV